MRHALLLRVHIFCHIVDVHNHTLVCVVYTGSSETPLTRTLSESN